MVRTIDTSVIRSSEPSKVMVGTILIISSRVRTLSSTFSCSFSARIDEEDDLDLQRKANEDEISVSLKWREFDLRISDRVAEILPVNEVSAEETEISGGGTGKGRKIGGGGDDRSRGSDWNGDRSEIRAYYEEMLKAYPLNPLLLTNYGKFLHEVERDYEKAEECYGKAILTSSRDGEVLSLHGKMWETQRDDARAKGYFRVRTRQEMNKIVRTITLDGSDDRNLKK